MISFYLRFYRRKIISGFVFTKGDCLKQRGYHAVPGIIIKGREIELDEEGFIINPDDWSDDLASALAAVEGITALNEDHWKVIYFLRDYYKQYQIAPMIRKLCKDTGCSLKYIYELFPPGPAKGACKLAGLPKPAGCV
jgi:TusE/DsrC/DsvC family sulfur relay protein